MERREQYITGVIAIVIAGLFAWFVYVPQRRELQECDNRTLELATQMSDTRRELGWMIEVQKDIRLLTDRLEVFDRRIPATPQLGEFLEMISSVAAQQGIRADEIEPLKSVSLEHYNTLPLTMELCGTYSDLLAFLRAIEKAERLVRLTEISLQTEEEETRECELVLEVRAEVFYQKT